MVFLRGITMVDQILSVSPQSTAQTPHDLRVDEVIKKSLNK